MDARIHVEEVLGLKTGDAHVRTHLTFVYCSVHPLTLPSATHPQIIRNGGGDAAEAVRSLLLSEQLLGTREIVLLKHTDCGFTHFTQPSGETVIKARLGEDVSNLDLKPFTDVDEAVRRDVAFLRAERLIGKDIKIWGGVFEVETGRVRQVVEA